jgi:hypothetical protein
LCMSSVCLLCSSWRYCRLSFVMPASACRAALQRVVLRCNIMMLYCVACALSCLALARDNIITQWRDNVS